ncbi:MAG: serine/threonine protein kinase [Myxococcaceae bacterium]|nr:serine/threonine protein kinase [Myxococcaceae bacterium]
MPRETSPPLAVGQYTLHGVLSSGGMATVHFGRLMGPAGFSRTVAIKRLHAHYAREPELVSMFVDEARVVSRIRHPNVVPTLDVVQTDGELFLIMEYVHGESLAKILTNARLKNQRVPLPIVSAIITGLLHGLHAAHEAKHPRTGPLHIVHRDVSPQNVLVGTDGTARILDFGVAKAMHRIQVTREGQLKGKIPYMAPEQLRGAEATRATDIFAASVVLWETLTGRRLFNADNEGAMVKKILEEPIPLPSLHMVDMQQTAQQKAHHLHELLDALVLRGLARDPSERHATARDMARELEAIVAPAAPSQVGEWVERMAAASLAERAQRLNEIGDGAGDVLRADALAQVQVSEAPSEPSVNRPSVPSSRRRRRSSRPMTTDAPRALYILAAIVLLLAAIVGSFAIYYVWRRA